MAAVEEPESNFFILRCFLFFLIINSNPPELFIILPGRNHLPRSAGCVHRGLIKVSAGPPRVPSWMMPRLKIGLLLPARNRKLASLAEPVSQPWTLSRWEWRHFRLGCLNMVLVFGFATMTSLSGRFSQLETKCSATAHVLSSFFFSAA